MPLRSEALRDSRALQGCLVQDAQHMTRGAHVSKIQKGLILIEKAEIPVRELRAQL